MAKLSLNPVTLSTFSARYSVGCRDTWAWGFPCFGLWWVCPGKLKTFQTLGQWQLLKHVVFDSCQNTWWMTAVETRGRWQLPKPVVNDSLLFYLLDQILLLFLFGLASFELFLQVFDESECRVQVGAGSRDLAWFADVRTETMTAFKTHVFDSTA